MKPSVQSGQTHISVQQQAFDIGVEFEALHQGETDVGAVVTFTGLVRDLVDSPLQEMVLEHYPGMTESALQAIADQARQRWPLKHIRIIHRVGTLKPMDLIVYVGVSSAHRDAAFAASEFIMDYLKKDAPFWKKERTQQGEHWVEQKQSDLDSAERWRQDD